MKLTLNEYKEQLDIANTLTGEARTKAFATLKSAEVVEVAADGKETPVKVEVVEAKSAPAPEAKPAEAVEKTVNVDAAAVKRLVDAALAENNKAPIAAKPGGSKRFTVPAEVKRYSGSIKNFIPKAVNGFEPDERAFRFGMWILAAKGSPTARQFCSDHGIGLVETKFSDELLQKLHQENVNTSGAFLVPEEFGSDIIDLKETYGVVRRLFNNVPMMSDTRTDPRRTGGLTAYAVGEGAAGTESTGTWDQVRLTAKDWMVLTRMTNQLNADAVISMADKLAYEIAYAHTLKEDQTGFVGTGTSTYGGIVGVNSALTNKWGTGGTVGLVKQGTGTTWGAIVLADFHGVVGTLPQYADTPRTCWVCHRSFYYGVMQKLELASGGVPATEIRSGNRAPRPLFLGYPVEFAQAMPGTTASAQVSALFGDFTLGASFGDRQQDQIAFSTEASVGGQSVFERNETAVRGVARWDINVHDVGDGSATSGPICGLITG